MGRMAVEQARGPRCRRRSGAGTAAILLIIGVAALASPSRALASGRDYTYRTVRVSDPGGEPHGRWAERTAVAGDLDGDGVNDIFVGQPARDGQGMKNVGRVYALSGADLGAGRARVLYAIEPPEPQLDAAFGFVLTVLGDVNGDGKADLAVGTDGQDVGSHVDQGKAWVFSGADGRLLYALDNPAPQGAAAPENEPARGHRARFGSRLGRAGDITGDGVSEVIAGASGNDVPAGCSELTPFPADCRAGQGQAFVFDGASGALLRTLDLPSDDQAPGGCTTSCGTFGLSVQGPGDTDGDGVADQLVSAPSYKAIGRMYVFSGRTGELLLRIDDPVPQPGALFGFQDAAPLAPGDLNGDGRADLYGNGFLQNVRPTGTGEGRAWVFDGATGAVLYSLQAPVPRDGDQFGFSLAGTDFDRDGKGDLYIGSSPHHVPGSAGSGGTFVFNGQSGALMQVLGLPLTDVQPSTPRDLGPNLGWTVSAPGDLNGDGRPDYLAGAPFADRGANQDEGALYVFLSGPAAAGKAGHRGGGGAGGDGGLRVALGAVLAAAAVGGLVLWRRGKVRDHTQPPGRSES